MASNERSVRRFWHPRAIALVAVPLVLLVIIGIADRELANLPGLSEAKNKSAHDAVHFGLVIAGALIAIYAVNEFVRALGSGLEEYLGLARARATATFASVVLYSAVILIAINSTGANLSGILLGGAVTGVIVGIAGQASLSNIIAGLVILFARPFRAGMYLTVRAGVFGGVEYSGQVWDISLFYTTLHSAGQEIRIPNSTMIAAVVVERPQELDVYVPITFPVATDLPERLETLRRTVAGATAARRAPLVTLEKVTELGYIVGVRVFVAGEFERRAVERAIAGIVQQNQAALAAAAPPPAPQIIMLARDHDDAAAGAAWEAAERPTAQSGAPATSAPAKTNQPATTPSGQPSAPAETTGDRVSLD